MPLKNVKINDKLSWRDVNGELVALDVVTGEYHVFNDIGRLIWLAIADEKQDMDALINTIAAEYDIGEDEITNDIKSFIVDLTEREILTKTNNDKEGETNGTKR